MRPAPTDEAAEAAFERIAEIAREHALVVDGYGGIMFLATPEAQRKSGERGKVLSAHRMVEP